MSKAPTQNKPKQKIGIQANLVPSHKIDMPRGGVRLPRFDPRSTSKVEETRAPGNGKPYRNAVQKAKARAEAFSPKQGKFKGTYISYTPTQQRPMVND